MPKAEVIRAGVIGWPVSHSLSPRLHGYWLKQYGINGTYEAIAAEPGDLKQMLQALLKNGFAGVNLTIPHKEKALALMNEVSAEAKRIGAINAIVMRGGKFIGGNTDGYGFIENIKPHLMRGAKQNALIIGAGGAARAICVSLLAQGADVSLVNRTPANAKMVAGALGGNIRVIDWSDYATALRNATLLVNATPLGMRGQKPLELSLELLPENAVVTDIVYNPLMTPLLTAAKARGNKIVDGLGMLLYQAQPAFEAFFGVRPEVTEKLREYVLKGLAA